MADRIHPRDHSPSAPSAASAKNHDAFVNVPLGAAAHPYQLPQPPKRRRRASCCCCISWIAGLIALIVVLLGIVVLVFWLVLRPIHSPRYTVEDVQLPVLRVDQISSEVSADIGFRVRAENPNRKIGIYYDKVNVFAFYRGFQVGQGSIPAFYQGHRNVTFLKSNISATATHISKELATSLGNDIAANSVPIDIVTRVRCRIKAGAAKSPKLTVRSTCRLRVKPPSAPGGARLMDKSCKVKVRL